MHEAISEKTHEKVHICHADHNELYLCRICKSRVFVVKGEKKRPHFRHKSGLARHGLDVRESETHKYAKDYIELVKQIRTPDGKTITFERVEIEKIFGGVIADAVGYIDSKIYLIEICVHHAVDETKLKKLEAMNVNTIEINLRDWLMNPIHMTGGIEFANYVLFEANRSWLTRSGWAYWKTRITDFVRRFQFSAKHRSNFDVVSGQRTLPF